MSTPNLLRKVLVLGRRLHFHALVSWAESELNGYTGELLTDIPPYRGPFQVPVEVWFVGPGGFWSKNQISKEAVPDEGGFRDRNFFVHLYQPILELEILAAGEHDPEHQWDTLSLSKMQKWSSAGKTVHMEFCGIRSVKQIIPRNLISGVIDAVRNKALTLALDLQADLPEAGESGGPTTNDKEVNRIVNFHFNTNIHGGTNTVGMGENVTQNVQVNQGDYEGLAKVLKSLGIEEKDRAELVDAVEQDGGKPGAAVNGWLGKLGSGAIKVAGAAATPAVIGAVKAAITSLTGVPIP